MRQKISSRLVALMFCAGILAGTHAASAATVAAPIMTPLTGTYFDEVEVSMGSPTLGAIIRYTTDGSDPDMTSDVYIPGFPVYLDETTIVKAFAYNGLDTDSTITTETYTIVPTPAPALKLSGKKSFKTTKPVVKIKGTSMNADSVEYALGAGNYKTAVGVGAWSFKVRLKPGKNEITVYGIGEYEDSDPLVIKVTYTKKK
jgi:hypothetical protein